MTALTKQIQLSLFYNKIKAGVQNLSECANKVQRIFKSLTGKIKIIIN